MSDTPNSFIQQYQTQSGRLVGADGRSLLTPRSRSYAAALHGQANLRDVTVVGAAAATEHIDVGVTLAQLTILNGELNWITVIEINRLV